MNRHLIAALLLVPPMVCHAADSPRPNIVLCMSDDQGWGDTSYNGHPVLKTPNLDAMAANGMRFDRFYAAQHCCSPTRASVLTGRHPERYRCHGWGHDLPLREITLAEVLRAEGYATGHFGKWHLGGVPNGSGGGGRGVPESDDKGLRHPGNQGFETWFSTGNWLDRDPAAGMFFKNSTSKPFPSLTGDTSDIVMEQAISFIRDKSAKQQPFLGVIWFPSPHWPYRPLDPDKAPYADHAEAGYFGEMAGVDRAMGRLRAELRRLGIAENTLLWFNSDNGAGAAAGSTGGLSGGKGMLLEGGLRVPGIIEWPARIRQPARSSVPAGTVDIYPTACAAAGITPPNADRLDGINLLPLLDGQVTTRSQPLGFQASNPSTTKPTSAAWMDGKWKLLRLSHVQRRNKDNTGDAMQPGDYVFDLSADSAEAHDLKSVQPETYASLKAGLDAWQASLARSAAEYPFQKWPTQPKLVLATPVRPNLILDDPLSSDNLRERWNHAGGNPRFDARYDFKDGALRGRELPGDNHSAGAGLWLRLQDALISLAVKLDGAKVARIKLWSKEHDNVAQFLVQPDSVSIHISGRRLPGQKPEPDQDLIMKQGPIASGEWHHFDWELIGDKTALRMDGKVIGQASHPNLNVTKDQFYFTVLGDSASFRDLQIWDLTPQPGQ